MPIQLISRKKSSGSSLLEVLISIVVLAVGLLGLLNLQMTSLKNNHSAQLRTTATILTYDILDRIRRNKKVDYTLAFGDADPTGTSIKDQDLNAWRKDIKQALPAGKGEISYNGKIVTVKVQWDDSRAGGSTATAQTFQVSSEP